MARILFAFAIVSLSFCGELTNMSILLNRANADLQHSNMVMENPHLKPFEKEYYINPGNEQSVLLAQLADRTEQMNKGMRNSHPFAGYNSLDTNLYNRFVKEDYQNEQYRQIANLLQQIRMEKEKQTSQFRSHPPIVDPSQTANIKKVLKEIDKAQDNNELRLPHTYDYNPQTEQTHQMQNIEKQMETLQKTLSDPPKAPQSTDEELAALRRLDEKMGVVSKRIHSLPDENMEDFELVQAQMLSSLASLLRATTNAVDTERRMAFLYQVRMLVQKHHLQDHPFIHEFEYEISRSIADKN